MTKWFQQFPCKHLSWFLLPPILSPAPGARSVVDSAFGGEGAEGSEDVGSGEVEGGGDVGETVPVGFVMEVIQTVPDPGQLSLFRCGTLMRRLQCHDDEYSCAPASEEIPPG